MNHKEYLNSLSSEQVSVVRQLVGSGPWLELSSKLNLLRNLLNSTFAVNTSQLPGETISEALNGLQHNVETLLPTFDQIGSAAHGVPEGIRPKDVSVATQAGVRYAYMLLHGTPGWMVVYNVDDPTNPIPHGYASVSNGPNSIEARDDHGWVYAVTNTGKLTIFDVSDPDNPFISGELNLEPGLDYQKFDFAMSDDLNHAFLADTSGGNGLQVVDTSDKENPVGPIFEDPYDAGGADCVGNILAVTDYTNSKLKIYDVSDPTAPVLQSSTLLGSMIVPVSIQGSHAYVGEYNAAPLYIMDISDPTAPVQISMIQAPGPLTFEGSSFLSESEDMLYVCTRGPGTSHVTIYDIRDLENPQQTNLQYTPASGEINGSYLYDGYVYIPDYAAEKLSILQTPLEKLAIFGLTVGRQRLRMPSGPTAKRPGAPVLGEMFFDTDLGKAIVYSGSAWANFDGSVL